MKAFNHLINTIVRALAGVHTNKQKMGACKNMFEGYEENKQ